VLLPQVVDAVDIPAVAAGGFHDGRGLVAAPVYGAAGVAMGTRSLLTSESTVPDTVKRRYLAATVRDITLTRVVDGLPHRMLRTEMVAALIEDLPSVAELVDRILAEAETTLATLAAESGPADA
jgi:NAD(P)H-dependent flavin oxidoreductase YrpB (nitropropane dioxygenase family)